MKNLLRKYGYNQEDSTKEWHKDDWTVRLYETEMEIFNSEDSKIGGKYYKDEATLENLEKALQQIEIFY